MIFVHNENVVFPIEGFKEITFANELAESHRTRKYQGQYVHQFYVKLDGQWFGDNVPAW